MAGDWRGEPVGGMRCVGGKGEKREREVGESEKRETEGDDHNLILT